MSLTLPGVSFQTQPPVVGDRLPRMDVAAFVGFAAAGPVNIPVPVEDAARFRDIFGDDLPLAWDSERGQMQVAHLGAAVEAFFRNGGRRCWVVRVADAPVANRFALPGLVEADSLRPAVARARSGGCWSDDLWVGTAQESLALDVAHFDLPANGYRLDVLTAPGEVVVGDLVELRFDDGLLLYVPVAQIQPSSGQQRLEGRRGVWFLRHVDPAAPPVGTAQVVLVGADGETPLPLVDLRLPEQLGDPCVIDLELGLAEAPQAGDLLRLEFAGHPSLLCPVAGVEASEAAASPPSGSPPAETVRVVCAEPLWILSEAAGRARFTATYASPPVLPLAARMRFGLWVWRAQELRASLVDLGFSAAHPRFWGGLPADEPLFAWPTGDPRQRPALPFEDEVRDPRFPLAGPAQPSPLYLPVGMALAPAAADSLARLAPDDEATALERDGLAVFSAGLFMDERLAGLGVRSLLAEANDRYFLQDDPPLAPTAGFHSLLPVEEATLVAVPDAVHAGWEETTTPMPDLLPAPVLEAVEPLGQAGFYRVRWSAVAAATAYVLEEAGSPSFVPASVRYRGVGTSTEIFVPAECPQRLSWRVRALRQNETSPWSNTVTELLPAPTFVECLRREMAAPVLEVAWTSSPPGESYLIGWDAVPGATLYRLEEATDPLFRTLTSVVEGTETSALVRYRAEATYFYRVRAERDGEPGPWSTTQAVLAAPQARWTLRRTAGVEQTATLLAVQRALLRFCAARGDLFAVLSLPVHFRVAEALRYQALLLPRADRADEPAGEPLFVPPLNFDEAWLFSYAAVYHPWLFVQPAQTDLDLRRTPPDGAVVGVLAAVALDVGAWRAPANRVLRGILALEPAFDRAAWADLFAAQINLVREEAGGFVVMGADTLSRSSDLRPIHVRRLLILLRRLALREGNTYVFAPNSPQFRRRVQHRFEQVMAQLHGRGAFAGTQPDQAYRVVTGASVNPPASLDQGRFVVELRVAPAQALAFLVVRLIQNDRENLFVEEI